MLILIMKKVIWVSICDNKFEMIPIVLLKKPLKEQRTQSLAKFSCKMNGMCKCAHELIECAQMFTL